MKITARRALHPGERIRVLVVDDSAVMRRLVSRALEEDAAIEVVGSAANGVIALDRIPHTNPDVITLDIEMPEMDGLTTLRRIRRDYPSVRVIMCSTLTERGAAITLDALSAGADDYVTKVSHEGSLDRALERLRAELVPRIRQFFRFPDERQAIAPTSASASAPASPALLVSPRVVVIGVSTGGPSALTGLLPLLPASFPYPVLVVQHMPPLFTRFLAERLNASCSLAVHEAAEGDRVESGNILIAPGDFHMRVATGDTGTRVRLDQSPPLNSCRPAVDALFTSASEVYGGAVLTVILTGMGQDGLRGAQILKAQGAFVIAQDEASSVVWGMPGAIVNAGLADRVLPLDRIAAEIISRTGCS